MLAGHAMLTRDFSASSITAKDVDNGSVPLSKDAICEDLGEDETTISDDQYDKIMEKIKELALKGGPNGWTTLNVASGEMRTQQFDTAEEAEKHMRDTASRPGPSTKD